MKIFIDGKEYELTSHELYDAYKEQRLALDREVIIDKLKYEDDEWFERHGITRIEAQAMVDDMAEEYRYDIEEYEMSPDYALSDAISTVLGRRKAGEPTND